jgi:hypothetical protein
MTTEDTAREAELSRSFSTTTPKVGGFKFRKFSIGSLSNAQVMGLTLVTDEGAANEMPDAEKIAQCMAIAWMQCSDEDEVLDAIEAGTWKRAVRKFQNRIALDELPDFLKEITKTLTRASKAAVETQPREQKSGSKEDQPPGN